ncbi:hypothetical protein [Rubrivirga sp. IMCC43871]|uniref:hypothetical protein n=1 Tax=Rubrivirga sp. IMCC43871 TaxID=3391575 RepID=UPI00398FFAF5
MRTAPQAVADALREAAVPTRRDPASRSAQIDAPVGDPPASRSVPASAQSGDVDAHAPSAQPLPTAPSVRSAGLAPGPMPAAEVAAALAAVASDEAELGAPDASLAEGPDGVVGGAASSSPSATTRAEAPARLAAPAWGRALDAAGGRAVRLDLPDGGSVRLQAASGADGVAVSVRFSDPDLQALAGAHAAQLREVLDAHFGEPVRLTIADASAASADGRADGRADGDASGSPGDRPHGGHGGPGPPDPTSSTPTPSPAPVVTGRYEWFG